MVCAINGDGTLKFDRIGGPVLPTYDGEYCQVITRDGKSYTGTFLCKAQAAHVHKGSGSMERTTDTMIVRLDEVVHNKEDVKKLEVLSDIIKDTALCGLGQTAPNPVLTTVRYFKDEYEAHINKTCPAHECEALKKFSIDAQKCKGCTMCARQCPVSAIKGEVRAAHVIDQDKCIKCGACMALCKFGAVVSM